MIEVDHISKDYDGQLAVRDLCFTVEDGRIYGLLGPNGAGKSTTMNIMTGCLAPTLGSVRIDGFDIFSDAANAKRRIGYLPEQPPLYQDMTPLEYLRFVARVKGVAKASLNGQLEKVIAVTQIDDMKNRLIKNLSKGYKQRVGIAQALLGDPEAIILDEPTVGLDPKQIIEMRELIQALGREHTVILSSHILSEVQTVCDQVLIINKGELVASDTPENLEKLFAGTLTLRLTARAAPDRAAEALSTLPGVEWAASSGDAGKQFITVTAPADTDEDALRESVFYAFSKADLPILDMTAAKASLEDIFLEFTGGQPGEDAASSAPGNTGKGV